MIKYLYISILLAGFLLTGCEKSPQALKPAGKVEMQIRAIGNTNKLFLTDDVDLVFSDSVPADEVWIVGGKYLLDWITVESNNDSLIIGNDNKANWLRSYEIKPLVKVNPYNHYYLEYDAAGTVSCESAIIMDSINISICGGGGSLFLDLDVYTLTVSNNSGTVDVNMKGYSYLTYLYNGGYGVIKTEKMGTNILFMTNNGVGDVHSTADVRFVGRIHNSGNVYIYNNPEETDLASSGSGQFITVQ